MGPLKHLSKEALEAAAEPDDLSEWADMQFLLWDAQRRAGISDAEITAAMEDKLKINMKRQWPEPKDGEPRLHIKEPGNSPVTPDGWISCSERMPEKYDFDIWVFSPSRGVLDGLQWDGSMFTDDEYQFVIHDATHWMRKAYPAAPQQDGE
ncbi:dATP/dGTP pyrophosphohydrolase domain-containing protein [Escherichia coli]